MKYMKSLFCYLLFIFTVNAEELKTTENDPLKFSGNYFFYGGASADVIEGKDQGAFSGIARMTVNWVGYRDESDQDTGQLQLRLDHKHSYTDATPKDFMMSNVGGFGLIQPAFSYIGFRLTNLYWRKEFNAQDTELMVGFLDSTDYIDTYALGNPWSGFSNVQFSTGAGAIAIPDESTLGVTVKHMMSANFYTLASFSDAKADSTEPFTGIDNIINENHYFKSVEIGWIPSKEVFYVQNVHLIVWHSYG
uniref:Porin n=1 Tax=Aliivibrio wodanis TaxID=80852 RepID=A0A5Q4YYZ1_9GAMM|nr:hypothetical protein AW0309160_03450 [Aliivibrio wodanis]